VLIGGTGTGKRHLAIAIASLFDHPAIITKIIDTGESACVSKNQP
jgi:ATP-dependent protease Clp ATPase subunit